MTPAENCPGFPLHCRLPERQCEINQGSIQAFVKLCNKARLLSHESVVIDGAKFRAVNADNKIYVSNNAKKVLLDVEEKISRYMKELDEAAVAEPRLGALTKEDIARVLDYLERRKAQLTEALEQMAGSGGEPHLHHRPGKPPDENEGRHPAKLQRADSSRIGKPSDCSL